MKPLTKGDSWCYTASKTSARKKVKRHSSKDHRVHDKKLIDKAFEENAESVSMF